jgi:two-component system cell cycle sensor histidine kinase PleC
MGLITKQVNDLLDITRLDTGKLSIHQQPEDLSLLISRVVATMNTTAQHKSLTIAVSSQLDTPTVWIDQSRIMQVLTNLLSNAIKFTPPGGAITVDTSDNPEDPSSVCLSVCDTGCGIAPEHFEHIFDRLYQVEGGHSRAEGGLGLGLTITGEIIKLHGGQIAVRSQLGHGTQFTITIPKKGPEVIHPPRIQGDSREIKNSAR